ncbi:glycosyltransferase family 4 protein [Desulfovibrio sp. OttesenSCG-928-O18]|nr:glycosyltransferase family 4 protein [Desulfovibrio sp. OttesenSCG-928-O18]
MKIAYVASLGSRYFNGVLRKITSQLATWNAIPGVEAQLFCRAPEGLNVPEGNVYRIKGTPTFSYSKSFIRDIRAYSPDVVYFRHEICGFQAMELLRAFSGKIVMEVNSDLGAELKLEGERSLRRRLAYYFNKATSWYLERHLSGCVCISAAFLDFFPSVPRDRKIFIPNSIDLARNPVLKPATIVKPKRPCLLFMGTPNQIWHGVDLLPPLARALPDCDFHIVGPEPIAGAPSNMVFHGYQPQDKLANFYARSHIGIGSLAFFRKNMNETNTLKVREYLAAGLPVIFAHNDSVFLQDPPPWALALEPREGLFEQPEAVAAVRRFIDMNATHVVSHEECAPYIGAHIMETRKIEQLRRWFPDQAQ